VANVVNNLPEDFELADVVAKKQWFSSFYPDNNTIEAKVRQTLQVLRDDGEITFVSPGRYRRLPRPVGTPPAAIPTDIGLRPGQRLTRSRLHDKFGGSRQSGISPSPETNNIFIFTAASGAQHGYHDRLDEDGTFHYTGEGQVGDQQMTRGNLAILSHKAQGRNLHVFNGASGSIVYPGRYAIDDAQPFYAVEVHDREGESRQALIFRLRRLAD
jgi:hypothetical protein